MFESFLDDAIHVDADLRRVYEPPSGLTVGKEIAALDEVTRRFIACSPLVFVATSDADGRCDLTPRGGPAGFVTVLGDDCLAIPDATGNRRLDSYRNVIANGHAGLMFLIPGRGQTLRVNGRAVISTRAALLDRLMAVGKPPRSALIVEAQEVFAHCPKALIRSGVWEPETWMPADRRPSPAEVTHAHLRRADLSVEEVEQAQQDSLRKRLA